MPARFDGARGYALLIGNLRAATIARRGLDRRDVVAVAFTGPVEAYEPPERAWVWGFRADGTREFSVWLDCGVFDYEVAVGGPPWVFNGRSAVRGPVTENLAFRWRDGTVLELEVDGVRGSVKVEDVAAENVSRRVRQWNSERLLSAALSRRSSRADQHLEPGLGVKVTCERRVDIS